MNAISLRSPGHGLRSVVPQCNDAYDKMKMGFDSVVGQEERANDPALVALSDHVSAIIIMLLVLEIHAPGLAHGQSLRDMGRESRSSFVSYLISFVVVAISGGLHLSGPEEPAPHRGAPGSIYLRFGDSVPDVG